jgi:hypothetical protein
MAPLFLSAIVFALVIGVAAGIEAVTTTRRDLEENERRRRKRLEELDRTDPRTKKLARLIDEANRKRDPVLYDRAAQLADELLRPETAAAARRAAAHLRRRS